MDHLYQAIFAHQSHQICLDRQFVLQSRGINSQIVQTEEGYALVVESEHATQAQVEMASYVDENIINAPTPSNTQPKPLKYIPALVAYVLILSLVSTAAGFGLFGIDWYVQGRVDAGQIYSGEWWRLITALTLHANDQHLLSNIAFGLLFLLYFARYVGYGMAGLATLVAGLMGNAINVYMHGSTHFSIGASTAVFAVLGLLSGYVWKMKYFSQATWPKRLGPIFGGIVLLAFTGTSGENTDIGAHLWGFASGLVVGWLIAKFNEKIQIDNKAQKTYSAVALGLLTLSWFVALVT